MLTGLPHSIVDFCMRRLSSKGLLPNSRFSAISNYTGLPSEFRVPYSAELSTICIQLLQKCESSGHVDEALFVWELLRSGQTFEAVSCNIAHLMTSSTIAAYCGKLWTITPTQAKSHIAIGGSVVNLPPLKQCVFIEFNDSILPSLSMSSSVAAALPTSSIRFEELLSEAAQSLLQQSSSIDLSLLASAMKDTHGSLPRSIFSILSGKLTSQEASTLNASSRMCVQDHQVKRDDAASRTCYLCLLNGDDNPVAFFNSCGHGLCGDCWKSLVSAALASSSTPAVKSGEDMSGAVTVLSMKCSADPEGKCNAKIDFGVLCQAVPHLVKPFIRSTMSNLSRLLLSGGAGTCQCACGAVVSGVCRPIRVFKLFFF